MLPRVREAVAILAAPMVLFLAIGWHRPPGLHMTPLVTLAVYAFSHVLFWPPTLSVEVLARRISLSTPKRLLLVFAFSMILPGISMVLLHAIHEDPPYGYGWHGALDELVGEAVATTLSYVLYRFLSAREPRIDLLRRA
jgi:hypothetical protein